MSSVDPGSAKVGTGSGMLSEKGRGVPHKLDSASILASAGSCFMLAPKQLQQVPGSLDPACGGQVHGLDLSLCQSSSLRATHTPFIWPTGTVSGLAAASVDSAILFITPGISWKRSGCSKEAQNFWHHTDPCLTGKGRSFYYLLLP